MNYSKPRINLKNSKIISSTSGNNTQFTNVIHLGKNLPKSLCRPSDNNNCNNNINNNNNNNISIVKNDPIIVNNSFVNNQYNQYGHIDIVKPSNTYENSNFNLSNNRVVTTSSNKVINNNKYFTNNSNNINTNNNYNNIQRKSNDNLTNYYNKPYKLNNQIISKNKVVRSCYAKYKNEPNTNYSAANNINHNYNSNTNYINSSILPNNNNNYNQNINTNNVNSRLSNNAFSNHENFKTEGNTFTCNNKKNTTYYNRNSPYNNNNNEYSQKTISTLKTNTSNINDNSTVSFNNTTMSNNSSNMFQNNLINYNNYLSSKDFNNINNTHYLGNNVSINDNSVSYNQSTIRTKNTYCSNNNNTILNNSNINLKNPLVSKISNSNTANSYKPQELIYNQSTIRTTSHYPSLKSEKSYCSNIINNSVISNLNKNSMINNIPTNYNNQMNYISNNPALLYSQETIRTKNTNITQKAKLDLSLNVEELLLMEEKLTDILIDLNNKDDGDPSNSCYEWWNFYGCCSLSGRYHNFYKDEKAKAIIYEHCVLEFISVMLCYDAYMDNLFNFTTSSGFNSFRDKFLNIFNLIHLNILLFCDYIISKVSSNCTNNIWVKKLKEIVYNNLIVKNNMNLNVKSKSENIRMILYHNDNIIITLKQILKEHPGKENYLDIIYNYLFNPQSVSLIVLSDIFRNKVLRFNVSLLLCIIFN